MSSKRRITARDMRSGYRPVRGGNSKKLRVNFVSAMDARIDYERIESILVVVANQMLILNSIDRSNYTDIQQVCYKSARANLRETDRTLRQLRKELK